MYHNNLNNFFHGIMFHHFHDKKIHIKSQGSISGEDLVKIINFIGRDNILDSETFLKKYNRNELKPKDVCFTFDDGIKSQIDVALPILEEYKIKSFFFVYSSMFEEQPDNLEIFRYFRTKFFKNIFNFYDEFYKVLEKNLKPFFDKNESLIKEKKIKFPHYTIEDIKFRLVRDFYLSKSDYEIIMFKMISEKKIKISDLYQNLFFKKDDLVKINKLGHTIGLHSHSHPLVMEKLDYKNQEQEYLKCLKIISRILNKPQSEIICMSHPCGSYNKDTLKILKKLGIKIGFKQIMTLESEKGMKKINNSFLEIARQDHSQIIRRIS